MKKKILAVLLAAVTAVSVAACGGAENTEANKKEFNAEELAEALVSEITYTGVMEEVPADEIDWYVDMEEGVTGIMYMVSGVSCEEVAVFTAPDEDTAKAMVDNIEELLADQEDQNAAYDAKAAQRIDSAVIQQKGNYVILCVSDDSAKAKELIKEAFGE